MTQTLCVFTPTYNRAYSLKKLYNSLVEQTSSDFYWLIVDDGSTDSTQELVASFVNESRISIDYVKTPNGGKQRAWNTAAVRCTAELFMCVDSDDYLTKDAVEAVVSTWTALPKDSVLGIATPRVPKNSLFPSKMKLKLKDIYSLYGYRGETCIATRTDIIRRHPFYVANGEKFTPELYVFDQIDQEGVHATLNREICKGEYLEDGYSAHYGELLTRNPNSYSAYKLQCAQYASGFSSLCRETFLYLVWKRIAHASVFKAAKQTPHRTLAFLLAPCAVFAAVPIKEMVKRS